MDFQNRVGSKTGGGGATSYSESNRDRRERLRKLALETIDISKDPYFMRNHLGTYECKLCLTLHNNEGSYLAHTQGKKHQSNLSRRAAKEAKKQQALPAPEKPRVEIRKFVKIGRPGYKVTKQQDPESKQQSLLFQVDYPSIVEGIQPKYRVMAAYEQHIEAPDKAWQYLMFAAEPYETIAFKIPSREVDNTEGKLWNEWNPDTKQFFLQFMFKIDSHAKVSNLPPPAQLAAQGQQNKLQQEMETGAVPMETSPAPPPPAPTHNPALISQQTFPNLVPMQPQPSHPHYTPQPVNPMSQHATPPLPMPPHANHLQGPYGGSHLARPAHQLPGPPHNNPLPHGGPLSGPPQSSPLSGPLHGNPIHGPHGIPIPPHGNPIPRPPLHGNPIPGPPLHGNPIPGPPLHGNLIPGPPSHAHGNLIPGPPLHGNPIPGPPSHAHGNLIPGPPPHGNLIPGPPPHGNTIPGPPLHGNPIPGHPHGNPLQIHPHGTPLPGPPHGGPFLPRSNPLHPHLPPPPPGNQYPPPGPRM